MALIGVSLIFASVVLFCLRRPTWFPNFFASLRHHRSITPPRDNQASADGNTGTGEKEHEVTIKVQEEVVEEDDQQTPKVSAAGRDDAVPSFTLSEPSTEPVTQTATQPATQPAIELQIQPPSTSDVTKTTCPSDVTPTVTSTSMMPPPLLPSMRAPNPPAPSLMAPPPPPTTSRRIPTLAPIPHSSVPKKPSRQVTLEPGHSPMDWARLAQSPTSDLRGLPPSTPYLRVTPSELRQMTGRKGKDAWCALGGKVYNFTPYLPFHPGGRAELLRGAGRDGTRMFGEVHPWVNYETMLSACLVGILVDEHEVKNEVGSKMEEMD
ncbi:hypothetical protein VPNG_04319 [Cytospora leucostoma]|uniref:Cytochrome b5 heme-binding domain-containing protein n=1 Tax=Cytospora leucostoma TaxID=1230097 RepID=A0A423XDQ8_9PEZI|nr:hypothetical protein VPNG_04319 [Cytospora leucostoma]